MKGQAAVFVALIVVLSSVALVSTDIEADDGHGLADRVHSPIPISYPLSSSCSTSVLWQVTPITTIF